MYPDRYPVHFPGTGNLYPVSGTDIFLGVCVFSRHPSLVSPLSTVVGKSGICPLFVTKGEKTK